MLKFMLRGLESLIIKEVEWLRMFGVSELGLILVLICS